MRCRLWFSGWCQRLHAVRPGHDECDERQRVRQLRAGTGQCQLWFDSMLGLCTWNDWPQSRNERVHQLPRW